MWALAINLPLIIGGKVPQCNEKWECFLLLLDILQLCTARVASAAQAGYLAALIFDHHHLFIRCYSEASVIPKLHYMVHFPKQILRYLSYHSTLLMIGLYFTEQDHLLAHSVCGWRERILFVSNLHVPATSRMCHTLLQSGINIYCVHTYMVVPSSIQSLNVVLVMNTIIRLFISYSIYSRKAYKSI